MPSEDVKFEQLADHYKDSCDQIKDMIKSRDRSLLPIFVIMGLMSFRVVSPDESSRVISNVVTTEFELKTPINMSFVESILWLALFALMLTYFRTMANLTRRYDYVAKLETKLSACYDNGIFTRESEHWSSHFRLFTKWSWVMYNILVPIILIGLMIAKMVDDLWTMKSFTFLNFVNIEVFVAITATTVVYLMSIHFHK